MKPYMNFGDVWDLTFRSFLVFIFFGLLWLKFIDQYIACTFGFPIPLIFAGLYFWRGTKKAKAEWIKENEEINTLEIA